MGRGVSLDRTIILQPVATLFEFNLYCSMLVCISIQYCCNTNIRQVDVTFIVLLLAITIWARVASSFSRRRYLLSVAAGYPFTIEGTAREYSAETRVGPESTFCVGDKICNR